MSNARSSAQNRQEKRMGAGSNSDSETRQRGTNAVVSHEIMWSMCRVSRDLFIMKMLGQLPQNVFSTHGCSS